jgi:hypothetical protein
MGLDTPHKQAIVLADPQAGGVEIPITLDVDRRGSALGVGRELVARQEIVGTEQPGLIAARHGGRSRYDCVQTAPAMSDWFVTIGYATSTSWRVPGSSSHVRPSSSRPPALGRLPPHCLKK